MTTYINTNETFEFIKSLADLKHELESHGHTVSFTYDTDNFSYRITVE